jgi:hypothetical protein
MAAGRLDGGLRSVEKGSSSFARQMKGRETDRLRNQQDEGKRTQHVDHSR